MSLLVLIYSETNLTSTDLIGQYIQLCKKQITEDTFFVDRIAKLFLNTASP